MRLTQTQIKTIKTETAAVFGPDARVHLFGSRLDDSARGGDIDLLIIADTPIADRVERQGRLAARLQRILGERKFDIVVKDPSTELTPFYRQVIEQAERL